MAITLSPNLFRYLIVKWPVATYNLKSYVVAQSSHVQGRENTFVNLAQQDRAKALHARPKALRCSQRSHRVFFMRIFLSCVGEYWKFCWAKLSILSLFHFFWSPQPIFIPSDVYGGIFNTSLSTVAPKIPGIMANDLVRIDWSRHVDVLTPWSLTICCFW